MKSQLKVRTEFSFRLAYGPIGKVVSRLGELGCESAAITDRSSTYGHIQWAKHCKQQGIKPLFGVELAFIEDVSVKERRQKLAWLPLIARTDAGLREIYAAVEEATAQFHYVPRLGYDKLETFSQDIIILSGTHGEAGDNEFVEIHPASGARGSPGRGVAVSDNYMITPDNRPAYEIMMGRAAFNRPSPMHLLSHWELRSALDLDDAPFALADRLAEECNATLPVAENIKFHSQLSLLALCLARARSRDISLNDLYMDRLHREISVIEEKQFTDYFFVIADLIDYAKTAMLVGPGRGSSGGSLVCFLLGITEIDPIKHNLIFERFIDITRSDLPDIDLDFQDDKRDLVFTYLENKYGKDHVGRLGTVSKYKGRVAIGEAAKALGIPPWEIAEMKNVLIKRDAGDPRANLCISDTLTDISEGNKLLNKFPQIAIAVELEGHARHSGKHASGVVVTESPIVNYVSKDFRTNTIQIDKYDAEAINLLKIDCLGIKTLSIVADCLNQIGQSNRVLLGAPLDDAAAFDILNKSLFCGIFQFEGPALQSIVKRIKVTRFSDLVALTSLARPGPLGSGATQAWVARHTGADAVAHYHPMTEAITQETYGLIIYQEQFMRAIREIGNFSWPDVSHLRKAINKKVGQDYFDKYKIQFLSGARSHGIDDKLGTLIWNQLNTMGSYAFNKSHAVAYSMLSYWCMFLKARHPLQFALATLRNMDDQDSQMRYLRELGRAGQSFRAIDPEHSALDWGIVNGVLLGGLLNVKGIGQKTAEDILDRRRRGEPLSAGQAKKLADPITPFDSLFELKRKFPDLETDPSKYGISSKITDIIDISERGGNFVIIARLAGREVRSLNEKMFLDKRNGIKVPNDAWYNLTLEDETASMQAIISRWNFHSLGAKVVRIALGSWLVVKGVMKPGQKRLLVERFKLLEELKREVA